MDAESPPVAQPDERFPYVTVDKFRLRADSAVVRTLLSSSTATAEKLLQALARPPPHVSVRTNTLKMSRDQMAAELADLWAKEGQPYITEPHPILPDVLLIKALPSSDFPAVPSTRKAVVLSRICGESVCRGSHIYARGIRAASQFISAGDPVSIYVDLADTIPAGSLTTPQLASSNELLYIGLGTAEMPRTEIFRAQRGLAVTVDQLYFARGPSLNGVLSGRMYVQSVPSALPAHVLGPQPGERVLDMCACPGAKLTHIAALMEARGTLVAFCRTKSKKKALLELCESFGVDSFVQAVKMDATRSVLPKPEDGQSVPSLDEVLAQHTQTGTCAGFPRECFDRVLLDPPCSALGLRPRLQMEHFSEKDLTDLHPGFQRLFMWAACLLLRPGGTLVYSTCTLNPHENEAMVRHALDKYPLALADPAPYVIGSPGLAGWGLSEEECRLVQRFDPCNSDTQGFFVAKFIKTGPSP